MPKRRRARSPDQLAMLNSEAAHLAEVAAGEQPIADCVETRGASFCPRCGVPAVEPPPQKCGRCGASWGKKGTDTVPP